MNKLLNASYTRAIAILRSHQRELEALADLLLKYETLDAEDVKAVVEGGQGQKRMAAKLKAKQAANLHRYRQSLVFLTGVP